MPLEALRLVRRELEAQASLHEEEMEHMRRTLASSERQLESVVRERDELLALVFEMRKAGWESLATAAGGGATAGGGSVTSMGSDDGALASGSGQLLDRILSAGARSRGEPSPKKMSEEQRARLAERLHAEGEWMRAKREETALAMGYDAEKVQTVGARALSEEEVQRITQRMYGEAMRHYERQEALLKEYEEKVEKGSWEIGGFGSVIQFGLPNVFPSWGSGPPSLEVLKELGVTDLELRGRPSAVARKQEQQRAKANKASFGASPNKAPAAAPVGAPSPAPPRTPKPTAPKHRAAPARPDA